MTDIYRESVKLVNLCNEQYDRFIEGNRDFLEITVSRTPRNFGTFGYDLMAAIAKKVFGDDWDYDLIQMLGTEKPIVIVNYHKTRV